MLVREMPMTRTDLLNRLCAVYALRRDLPIVDRRAIPTLNRYPDLKNTVTRELAHRTYKELRLQEELPPDRDSLILKELFAEVLVSTGVRLVNLIVNSVFDPDDPGQFNIPKTDLEPLVRAATGYAFEYAYGCGGNFDLDDYLEGFFDGND